jgi:hypothetical protein
MECEAYMGAVSIAYHILMEKSQVQVVIFDLGE